MENAANTQREAEPIPKELNHSAPGWPDSERAYPGHIARKSFTLKELNYYCNRLPRNPPSPTPMSLSSNHMHQFILPRRAAKREAESPPNPTKSRNYLCNLSKSTNRKSIGCFIPLPIIPLPSLSSKIRVN
jgi:hypothetical protein